MTSEESSGELLIRIVIGETLTEIGRALDMAIFSFGQNIPWRDAFGSNDVRSRFALHVQCPFNVLFRDKALLRSEDIRRPLAGEKKEEFLRGGWHLNGEDPTVFDAKVRSLAPVLAAERPVVENVSLDPTGDLKLSLSGNLMINVMPPGSADKEAWRFFDRQGQHAVFPPEDS
jgi:hypothetical protein